ncbi:Microsomal signal peptidase 25 kDa subunit (SPC25) [Geosmithia morbida]|uniref:Signal peptidase complex subunit 2 n=1 Tax=Geosmithia morbida TaxID=1094350 RepID=A0A9P4YXQ5_9HYPO|nr:Microsomal signal peptidase 25 kDa subunit (SPC25) [Geosmithia morbida]KAF4122939.1 Microsomal signal peptidase 25 kDa subunit (SPC25) [Geosmithia morbida]
MASEKISLYNQADLKNTTDDAVSNYLNSLGFTQKHTMTDVRLAIGYSSFAVATACFLWDYKLGFEDTKTYTAVAVALYTLLQGALMLWTGKIEEGMIYQGIAPSGEQIFIASSSKKFEPVYNLKISIGSTQNPSKKLEIIQSLEISRSFTEWFDETGRFVANPFQEFLASSVPIIGKADPTRVKSASQELIDANPELLDAILAGDSMADASGAVKKTGGKRRKV